MVTSPKRSLSANRYEDWICPDLRAYWKLARRRGSDDIVLRAINGDRQFQFSPAQGYALRYFTGKFTVAQVQVRAQEEFPEIDGDFVAQLIDRLVEFGILALETDGEEPPSGPRLKSCVQWIRRSDDYWILRNPENVTFLQVGDRDRAAIADLGHCSPRTICEGHELAAGELKRLLQLLAATGMLEGTQPQKRRRGKFSPMQLLFIKIPLLDPDPWLSKHIDKLRWIWTGTFAFLMASFLTFSAIFGFDRQGEIAAVGQRFIANQWHSLLFPFVLLVISVVAIHELGHAFTLKYYGGVVREMGLLLMCLFPAAYTDTTDSYWLSRFQRILVVGAGVLTQIAIAAIAFWTWEAATDGSWLDTSSYLLMMAALLTVALNLNPLAKFDGYYLAVAVTGINNLRSRSFKFYADLLHLRPSWEKSRDRWILAAYAPLSFLYILSVFGFILFRFANFALSDFRETTLMLLVIWLIYFYFPRGDRKN